MCKAGPAWTFTAGSHVIPDVHGHDRHAVVFVKDYVQAVRQRELRVIDFDLGCCGRRLRRRSLREEARRRKQDENEHVPSHKSDSTLTFTGPAKSRTLRLCDEPDLRDLS